LGEGRCRHTLQLVIGALLSGPGINEVAQGAAHVEGADELVERCRGGRQLQLAVRLGHSLDARIHAYNDLHVGGFGERRRQVGLDGSIQGDGGFRATVEALANQLIGKLVTRRQRDRASNSERDGRGCVPAYSHRR